MSDAPTSGRLHRLSHRAMFGLGSWGYAWLTRQGLWRSHTSSLVDVAGVEPDEVKLAIDLGCGPGTSVFGLAERLPKARLLGFDLSPEMVELAKRYAKDEPAHDAGMEFAVADARQLPVESASVDLITGHSFVYLVGDDVGLGREVARVLRPGGRCVFLEPSAARFPLRVVTRAFREPRFVASMCLWRVASRGAGRFTPERFSKFFDAAGLETVAVRATLDGLGTVGAARKPEH